MKKLTRQGQVLIFAIMLGIFFIAGFLILNPDTKQPEDEKVSYTVNLVAENQKIASTYLDSISLEKSSSTYQEYKVTLEKGRKIGDYELSEKQSFSKYLKLEGPNGEDVLSKQSKQVITHYAYSLLLTGDIQERVNQKTEEKTYHIVNARITYNKIPLVLLSNENSVSLANKDKSKEKIVNLQEFINALKSVDDRNKMISW